MIRADDEGPEVPAGKANQRGTEEDKNRNRRSEGRDETSRKPVAYRDSFKVRVSTHSNRHFHIACMYIVQSLNLLIMFYVIIINMDTGPSLIAAIFR